MPTPNPALNDESPAPSREFISRLDDWFIARTDCIAFPVVAVGFVLLLMNTTRSHLNADEALHYLLAHQASLSAVYRASLTNAHPPLFFLLLYLWQLLGNSEFTLRLLSVMCGTACLWVSFRWIGYTLGRTEGLIGLLLLTFCPTFISLSSEVRGYALLLLLMAGALYFLERALRERSPRMIALSSLTLYMANLVHYSAVWFTLAVGLYALVRILRDGMPARLTGLWLGFQTGVAGLWVFLYFTHVRTLRGSGMEQFAREGWLRGSYFHAGHDRLLSFLVSRITDLFVYLLASPVAGLIAFILFAASVVWLLAARHLPVVGGDSSSESRLEATQNTEFAARRSPCSVTPGAPPNFAARSFALLLLAPLAISFGAAAAGVYPFGGSRHSVFLLLVAVAGISYALGRLAGRRVTLVLLAAVTIAPLWSRTASTGWWEYRTPDQDRGLMTAAVGCIREVIPPGSLLFMDYQTSNLLGYYLGRSQITTQFQYPVPGGEFLELPYGGYRVIVAPRWEFSPKSFRSELHNVKQQYGLGPDTAVWVADAGWGAPLNMHMDELRSQITFALLRTFGPGISVFLARETTN